VDGLALTDAVYHAPGGVPAAVTGP
jgi:hypothetical protein